MPYEHRTSPLISRARFVARVLAHMGIALAVLVFSLALGMAGYMHFEQIGWIDAFLDSAMLLGGMGPVHEFTTSEGKLFAGLFALYAGLVFIVVAGLVLAPTMHRVLHRLHLDE